MSNLNPIRPRHTALAKVRKPPITLEQHIEAKDDTFLYEQTYHYSIAGALHRIHALEEITNGKWSALTIHTPNEMALSVRRTFDSLGMPIDVGAIATIAEPKVISSGKELLLLEHCGGLSIDLTAYGYGKLLEAFRDIQATYWSNLTDDKMLSKLWDIFNEFYAEHNDDAQLCTEVEMPTIMRGDDIGIPSLTTVVTSDMGFDEDDWFWMNHPATIWCDIGGVETPWLLAYMLGQSVSFTKIDSEFQCTSMKDGKPTSYHTRTLRNTLAQIRALR